MPLPAQLTLGISLKDEATFENYYSGQNEVLLLELKKAASGQGERNIYLYGTGGEGGSHLLQACCHLAHQSSLSSVYLPLEKLFAFPPDILEGLELLQLVCIDDLHMIEGQSAWEEKVFHLYNRIFDAGGRMIVTARAKPKALGIKLPDLVSRLASFMIYPLKALADGEKLSVLQSRASQRGISLSEEVGKFILTHCPRHMGTLFAALEALDKASLAAQRRLTIPFVKEVLQI